jgi:hypothetical protein
VPPPATTARQLNLPLRGAGSGSRRLYTIGKSCYTATRIRGLIREIVRRAGDKGKAHVRVADLMKAGFSERTVRKYLAPALAELMQAGEILMESLPGKGYRVWTPKFQALKDSHGDLFQAALCARSHWLTKEQRAKMVNWGRMPAARRKPTPHPCRNLRPHIGRDKSGKKQRRHAPAMTILAAKILSRITLPESKRFQVDPGQWQAMIAEALSAEHCRIEVARWVGKAGQALDAAISDRLSHRPEAYLWGIWRGFMTAAKPLGRERINGRRREFWLTERTKALEFAETNRAFLDPAATADALNYIERKIAG